MKIDIQEYPQHLLKIDVQEYPQHLLNIYIQEYPQHLLNIYIQEYPQRRKKQRRWDTPGEKWRRWPPTENGGVPWSMAYTPSERRGISKVISLPCNNNMMYTYSFLTFYVKNKYVMSN